MEYVEDLNKLLSATPNKQISIINSPEICLERHNQRNDSRHNIPRRLVSITTKGGATYYYVAVSNFMAFFKLMSLESIDYIQYLVSAHFQLILKTVLFNYNSRTFWMTSFYRENNSLLASFYKMSCFVIGNTTNK